MIEARRGNLKKVHLPINSVASEARLERLFHTEIGCKCKLSAFIFLFLCREELMMEEGLQIYAAWLEQQHVSDEWWLTISNHEAIT